MCVTNLTKCILIRSKTKLSSHKQLILVLLLGSLNGTHFVGNEIIFVVFIWLCITQHRPPPCLLPPRTSLSFEFSQSSQSQVYLRSCSALFYKKTTITI